MTTNELMEVLSEAHDQDASDARARTRLEDDAGLKGRFDAVAEAMKSQLVGVFTDPRNDPCALLQAAHDAAPDAGTETAIRALLRFCKRYEAYDSVTLPIAYGSVGESDQVEVIRVSPEDATGIVDELAGGCRKLGGIHYGHFGGFLNRTWRENDFMWGRLDAADRLLTALLPAGALRDELQKRAFHAILREERPQECATDEAADRYIAQLRSQCAQRKGEKDKTIVSAPLDRETMLGLVARGATITHKVLEGVRTNMLTAPLVGAMGEAAGWLGRLAKVAEEGVGAEGWFVRLGKRIRKHLPFGG
jgi:hypothetical protein